jgi:hypothetical protein
MFAREWNLRDGVDVSTVEIRWRCAMKSSIVWSGAVASVAMLTWPLVSLAQTGPGLTRAEVVQDLIRVEQAGYRPGWGDSTNYPNNILAAEARIAAQQGETARTGDGAANGALPTGGVAAPPVPDHQ